MTQERSWFIPFEPTVAHINYISANNVNRLEELAAVKRFDGVEMLQRFTVADHDVRVAAMSGIVSEALSTMGRDDIDPGKAMWKGDYHDEPERVTKDKPTPQKLAMSPTEKAEFEAWEMEIMRDLEPTLDKPTWAESAEKMYEAHRKKETIEDRLVDFFDKWDASNEVVHELVCGNAGAEFLEILGRYQKKIAELREQNLDWLMDAERIFGEAIFTVPDEREINKRGVGDLSFDSAKSFIDSITNGNPDSYAMWVGMNSYIWGASFLDRTFPGWVDNMPSVVVEAAHQYFDGKREFLSPSGLTIVGQETDRAMRFARSLGIRNIGVLLEMIDVRIDRLT